MNWFSFASPEPAEPAVPYAMRSSFACTQLANRLHSINWTRTKPANTAGTQHYVTTHSYIWREDLGEHVVPPPVPAKVDRQGRPLPLPTTEVWLLLQNAEAIPVMTGQAEQAIQPSAQLPDAAPTALPEVLQQAQAVEHFQTVAGRLNLARGIHGELVRLDPDGQPLDGIVKASDLQLAQHARRAQPTQEFVADGDLAGTALSVALRGPAQTPLLSGKIGMAVRLLAAPAVLLARGAIKDRFPDAAESLYQILPELARSGPPLLESLGHPYANVELLLAHIDDDPEAIKLVLDSANECLEKLGNHELTRQLWKLSYINSELNPDSVRMAFRLCNGPVHQYHYAAENLATVLLWQMQESYVNSDWPKLNGILNRTMSAEQAVRLTLLYEYHKLTGRGLNVTGTMRMLLGGPPSDQHGKPKDNDVMNFAQALGQIWGDKQKEWITTQTEIMLKTSRRFLRSDSFAWTDGSPYIVSNNGPRRDVSLAFVDMLFNPGLNFEYSEDRLTDQFRANFKKADSSWWRPERALVATHSQLFSDLTPVRRPTPLKYSNLLTSYISNHYD